MSDNSKILDRLQKLLKLAESTTHEGERAAAWDRINHLLTNHRLSLSDVKSEGQKIGDHPIHLTTYTPGRRWRLALLFAIREYLPIEVLFARSYAWVYCKPDELQLVMYFNESISNQLVKDAKRECKVHRIPANRAQKWRADFMFAAVEVISTRFSAMKAKQKQLMLAQSGGEKALMVLDQDRALVRSWVDEMINPKKRRAFSHEISNQLAQQLGAIAGSNANLMRPLEENS